MQSLRIVTINTWKCDGAYRNRLRWLGDELKRLQPDVIAMQECFRDVDGEYDTAAYLARPTLSSRLDASDVESALASVRGSTAGVSAVLTAPHCVNQPSIRHAYVRFGYARSPHKLDKKRRAHLEMRAASKPTGRLIRQLRWRWGR